MTRKIDAYLSAERLTLLERSARVAIGAGLMSTLLVAQGPLGWAALFPLLAIYPILTAVIGVEPLRALLEHDSIAYRAAQLSIGGLLVGSVFVTSAFGAIPMETFLILPLVGIYYVFAGILGRSPLASAEEAVQYEALGSEAMIPATVTAARITARSKATSGVRHVA